MACEIPVPPGRNLIREGKNQQVYSAVEAGSQFRMQTMEVALVELVRKGAISHEEPQGRSRTPRTTEA